MDRHDLIADALTDMANQIAESGWIGKEREVVSYCAFSFLVPRCRPGMWLYDPGQIATEVRVMNVFPGKREITKDLVIWPEPGMTLWTPFNADGNSPAVIMLWKWYDHRVSRGPHDMEKIDFLHEYTRRHPTTLGIGIIGNVRRSGLLLTWHAIEHGQPGSTAMVERRMS